MRINHFPWVLVLAAAACSSIEPDAPLPAPSNLSAVFFPNGVDLSWDPVPGAPGGYVVALRDPGGGEFIGQTQYTHVFVPTSPYVIGRQCLVYTQIRASNQATVTALRSLPAVSLRFSGSSVHVLWDSVKYGAGVIQRESDSFPSSVETIGTSSSGDFEDTGAQPGVRYIWTVVNGTGPDHYGNHSVLDWTPPLPPSQFTVVRNGRGFRFLWGPVNGPNSEAPYSVRYNRPSAPAPAIFSTTFPEIDSNCDGDAECTFQVASMNDVGAAGIYSSPQHVDATPAVPPVLVPAIGQGKVILTLPGGLPANADHVIVSREPNGGVPVDIGTATSSFTAAADPWVSYYYFARSVSAKGYESDPALEVGAVAVGQTGAAHLVGDAMEADALEGEIFTVPYGGVLRAVELAAEPSAPFPELTISAGGRALAFARLGGGVAGTALDADLVTGAISDCCSAVPVSAGEVIGFNASGANVAVGTAGSGGHLRHGSVDPAHDAVFKAFIDPDATLSDISPLSVLGGIGAVRLDWVASPGAQRYDVYYTTTGDPTPQLAGSTLQPWFVDPGPLPLPRSYSVTAVGIGGSVTASRAGFFAPRTERLAAQSLGDAPAASASFCPGGELAQTFKATAGGTIQSLEVGFEASSTVVIEIRDAHGAVLGRTPLPLFVSRGQVAPLDPVLPGSVSNPFDLSSLNIAVAPGDQLKLVLSNVGSACISLRDTVDAYPDGEEWRDGVAQPDRDLAFRILLH